MKYIAKAKGANRFKPLDSITEFETEDFAKYDLYEVAPVDTKRYGEILKNQKITELKEQLKELGVDLNSLVQSAPSAIPQNAIMNQNLSGEVTNESPLLMGDSVSTPNSTDDEVSNVKNAKTGKRFSMDEMRTHFEEFKAKIEKEVPEIMYSMCSPDGFKLVMSEERKDLPQILPNGIPLQQVPG
jgi:hypothetical protein